MPSAAHTGSRLLLGVNVWGISNSRSLWEMLEPLRITQSSRMPTRPASPHKALLKPFQHHYYQFWASSHRYSPFCSHAISPLGFLTACSQRSCSWFLQRRWPGHAGLLEPRPVTRVHGILSALSVVVMPVGVRVAAVFDFDGGPWLSPQMLGRLEGRLSLPWTAAKETGSFLSKVAVPS